MWQKLNSPIVITLIALSGIFVFKGLMKPQLASEVRGVYNELIAIVEDGTSDAEKTKAIQQFAHVISTQIREGFRAGFSSKQDGNNKDQVFFADKS